jgi:hypothetical protein
MTSFVHINKHKKRYEDAWISIQGTLAFEMPTKDFLNSAFLQHASGIYMRVGSSILNPVDNFNKQVGRELAESHMEPIPVQMQNIVVDGTRHVFHLEAKIADRRNKTKNLLVSFGISTIAESDNVRLLYAELSHV